MRNASMRPCCGMLLTMMPLCVGAKKYSAEPITARVVEAGTQNRSRGSCRSGLGIRGRSRGR